MGNCDGYFSNSCQRNRLQIRVQAEEKHTLCILGMEYPSGVFINKTSLEMFSCSHKTNIKEDKTFAMAGGGGRD